MIIYLSKLLKFIFRKSYYVTLLANDWKVPYTTRICAFNFKRYWLPSVLDFHNHSFFHWFLMEKKVLIFLTVRSFCAVIYQWDFFLQMVSCFASHQCHFRLNSTYGGLNAWCGSNNVKIDKEGFPEVWNTWKWQMMIRKYRMFFLYKLGW